MRKVLLVFLAVTLGSCATWTSPINQNSLLGEERTPSNGEVSYEGTIEATESVAYFLQSGGRQIRFRFEATAKREDGMVTLLFKKADFGASYYYKFQDLVQSDYEAEGRLNKSFKSDFIRQPLSEAMLAELVEPYQIDETTDELSLKEILRLLLKYVDLESLCSSCYVGNQTLKSGKVSIFGHDFTLATFATITAERSNLFDVDLESRLSASYLHKYKPKDLNSEKSDGSYYSLWGSDRTHLNYDVNTLLLNDMDLHLNVGGYQQAYFADTGKLYMLWPTSVRIHIELKRMKTAS